MAARQEEAARDAEAAARDAAAEDEERRAYDQFLEQERKRLERVPFQPKVYSLYLIVAFCFNQESKQKIRMKLDLFLPKF